ncbi:MAG: heavy metal translocating P-type ATPase [Acutalibacteraceae bacterium]
MLRGALQGQDRRGDCQAARPLAQDGDRAARRRGARHPRGGDSHRRRRAAQAGRARAGGRRGARGQLGRRPVGADRRKHPRDKGRRQGRDVRLGQHDRLSENRATRVGQDTTLARIVALVEEASSSKAPISKLADKVSGIFVPAVMAIAVVAGAAWLLAGRSVEDALNACISVLVISCPCALGLATPVAIMVSTGRCAQMGILIKSAEALELLHAADTVVLDKTGTITVGKPSVTDVVECAPGRLLPSPRRWKEKRAPLADAVVRYAADAEPAEVSEFTDVTGKGIRGIIDDRTCYGGSGAYMEELGVDVSAVREQAQRFAEDGKTPLFFACETELLGVIAAADTVKETSAAAVRRMKDDGCEVIMLTGDNETTANAVRRKLDLDRVIADVLPQDKERVVRELQAEGRKVIMVGDGINDSPALARADIGIAIGSGADIAVEEADVVLMKSDLNDVPTAIECSRQTMRNIKQNLFWAFFYNTLGIPLAAGALYPVWGVTLNPMIGAAAMSLQLAVRRHERAAAVSDALRRPRR